MTNNEFRLAEPNVAYIGAGVTIKGEINVPDTIVVDGTIEGDVTARSIRVGVSGSIKGNVVSNEAEVHGTLAEKVEVKQFLLVRSTGRIEGSVTCGDVQVEKGAVLAGGVFSIHPKSDQKPAGKEVAQIEPKPSSKEAAPPAMDRPKLAAAE
jgi:cytoskeletal protein CcmA (bactofilin family)